MFLQLKILMQKFTFKLIVLKFNENLTIILMKGINILYLHPGHTPEL